jgi:hypothetical protein
VRVLAIEASRVGCEAIEWLARLNDAQGRVRVLNYFVGGDTPAQHDAQAIPGAAGVPFIDATELVRMIGDDRVALLKCDIEGSEFGLLRPGSPLLARCDQVTMECHDAAGRREDMIALLEGEGFEVRVASISATDCILQARRKPPSPPPSPTPPPGGS